MARATVRLRVRVSLALHLTQRPDGARAREGHHRRVHGQRGCNETAHARLHGSELRGGDRAGVAEVEAQPRVVA